MGEGYLVYGAAGSGSTPVEATLRLLDEPYRVVERAVWEDAAAAADRYDEVYEPNSLRSLGSRSLGALSSFSTATVPRVYRAAGARAIGRRK